MELNFVSYRPNDDFFYEILNWLIQYTWTKPPKFDLLQFSNFPAQTYHIVHDGIERILHFGISVQKQVSNTNIPYMCVF